MATEQESSSGTAAPVFMDLSQGIEVAQLVPIGESEDPVLALKDFSALNTSPVPHVDCSDADVVELFKKLRMFPLLEGALVLKYAEVLLDLYINGVAGDQISLVITTFALHLHDLDGDLIWADSLSKNNHSFSRQVQTIPDVGPVSIVKKFKEDGIFPDKITDADLLKHLAFMVVFSFRHVKGNIEQITSRHAKTEVDTTFKLTTTKDLTTMTAMATKCLSRAPLYLPTPHIQYIHVIRNLLSCGTPYFLDILCRGILRQEKSPLISYAILMPWSWNGMLLWPVYLQASVAVGLGTGGLITMLAKDEPVARRRLMMIHQYSHNQKYIRWYRALMPDKMSWYRGDQSPMITAVCIELAYQGNRNELDNIWANKITAHNLHNRNLAEGVAQSILASLNRGTGQTQTKKLASDTQGGTEQTSGDKSFNDMFGFGK